VISPTFSPQLCWSLRVYYAETDAGGVVYHASYLDYFERARTEWLRQIGINLQEMANQQQAMFVMKSAQVEYHLPAILDDELMVTTAVVKLGRASAVFVQEVRRGEQCLVSGRFRLGCVNMSTVRPCALPPTIFDAMLRQIENDECN
jgi:acyl-CoA thioester hydrolase